MHHNSDFNIKWSKQCSSGVYLCLCVPQSQFNRPLCFPHHPQNHSAQSSSPQKRFLLELSLLIQKESQHLLWNSCVNNVWALLEHRWLEPYLCSNIFNFNVHHSFMPEKGAESFDMGNDADCPDRRQKPDFNTLVGFWLLKTDERIPTPSWTSNDLVKVFPGPITSSSRTQNGIVSDTDQG